MIAIDLNTLRVSILLTSMMCVIALMTIWRINWKAQGVRQWVLGLSLALAAFAIGLAGAVTPLSDRGVLLLTNVLSLITFMLLVEGCLRFRGHVSARRWKWIWVALPLVTLLTWFNLEDSVRRYLFHDAIAVTLLVAAAVIMVRRTRDRAEFRVYGLTSLFSLLLALVFLARWSLAAGSFVFGDLPVGEVNAFVYVGILVFMVGFSFAVIAACYYQSHQEVLELAARDELTGLPNRRAINDTLREWLKSAGRYGDGFAVVLIDLDRFKAVNDSMGHAAGDRVLREIARRLAAGVRETDLVGRFGGDEFVILMRREEKDQIEPLLERLWKRVGGPVGIDGREEKISLSFGVAHWPMDGETADELINTADRRMYFDKPREALQNEQEPPPENFSGNEPGLA